MRLIFALVSAVVLFGCQSMQSPETAKSEIAAATQTWIEGMTRHDIDGVVALYDSEAVLWGTRSPTLRDNPTTVREYFNWSCVTAPAPMTYIRRSAVRHPHRIQGDI